MVHKPLEKFLKQRGPCLCCGAPNAAPVVAHISEIEKPPRFMCQACIDDPSPTMSECLHGKKAFS